MKAMAKVIKQEGEATKVAVRAARKTLMEQIKKLASKDAQRQQEKQVGRHVSTLWSALTCDGGPRSSGHVCDCRSRN